MYQPIAQTTQPFFLWRMTYLVRPSSGSIASLAPEVRRVFRSVDPGMPIDRITTMGDLVSDTIVTPRFQSRLLLVFAALALVLAMIGVYGVLAYGVAQRIHEIGIRVALGATPSAVMANIMRRTIVLMVPGLALGIAGALAATRILSSYLFHVTPTDPTTFTAVVVLLGMVALAASYVPARRAARVDPLTALRTE
jgi:putative ABC transport system permease protein